MILARHVTWERGSSLDVKYERNQEIKRLYSLSLRLLKTHRHSRNHSLSLYYCYPHNPKIPDQWVLIYPLPILIDSVNSSIPKKFTLHSLRYDSCYTINDCYDKSSDSTISCKISQYRLELCSRVRLNYRFMDAFYFNIILGNFLFIFTTIKDNLLIKFYYIISGSVKIESLSWKFF